MSQLIRNNPVRFIAAIQATLGMIVIMDVGLSEVVAGAMLLTISAWTAFYTHQQVTPMTTLPEKVERILDPQDSRSLDEAVEEMFNERDV